MSVLDAVTTSKLIANVCVYSPFVIQNLVNNQYTMKKAEQLREQTDKLEEKVKLEVLKFITAVGHCDIKIDTEIRYMCSNTGIKELSGIDVKVYVTV